MFPLETLRGFIVSNESAQTSAMTGNAKTPSDDGSSLKYEWNIRGTDIHIEVLPSGVVRVNGDVVHTGVHPSEKST